MFNVPKTSSITLLEWHLAVRGEPPGDRVIKQWQWPLTTGGAWRQGWGRLVMTEQRSFYLALGAWRWELPARRTGTNFAWRRLSCAR